MRLPHSIASFHCCSVSSSPQGPLHQDKQSMLSLSHCQAGWLKGTRCCTDLDYRPNYGYLTLKGKEDCLTALKRKKKSLLAPWNTNISHKCVGPFPFHNEKIWERLNISSNEPLLYSLDFPQTDSR